MTAERPIDPTILGALSLTADDVEEEAFTKGKKRYKTI